MLKWRNSGVKMKNESGVIVDRMCVCVYVDVCVCQRVYAGG